MPRRRRRQRGQKGEGPVLDWLKRTARKAHDFIKDNRLISRGATALAPALGPYSGTVGNIGRIAAVAGYGKKKRRGGRRKKK